VTTAHRLPGPRRDRRGGLLVSAVRVPLVLAVLALTACTTGTASGPASAGSSPSHAATVRATPVPTTSTEWGAILDALPAGVPRFPSARDATPEGAASASLSTGSSVAQVVAWYNGEMAAAGYDRTASSGPLEDGSVVVEYGGGSVAPGCRVQVTAKPRGGETLIVILVAAACRPA
jgi:hypothetical protein